MSDRTQQLQGLGIVAILILFVTNLVLSTWTFLQLQEVAEQQASRSDGSAAPTGDGLAQRIKQQAEASLEIPDASSEDSTEGARPDGAGDTAASTLSGSGTANSADDGLSIPDYISPEVKRRKSLRYTGVGPFFNHSAVCKLHEEPIFLSGLPNAEASLPHRG